MVGCSSLVPVAWSLYSPQRDYAQSRYLSTLQDQFYQALNADPDLKARIRNLQIYVDFNHTESGEYTLQDGDTVSVYVELPENGYADALSFAADCRRIAELSEQGGGARRRLQFQKLHRQQRHRQQLFPGFPGQLAQGLTDEQLAQRVTAYYEYEGSSYSTQAERDNAVKAELRSRSSRSSPTSNDGAYPGDEYISEEVEKRFITSSSRPGRHAGARHP